MAEPSADFISAAKQAHGPDGEKAATFLVEHMPQADRDQLETTFLMENLNLALKARDTFVWAKSIPEELFLNDVLPYAVLDETREAWRPAYFEQASVIVHDAETATEAAQLLNRDFFNVINVHYNTGRKRPNQSPAESAELNMATCTGLSIILVDACRAVGVPARVAGTPLWTNNRGNHTWVEIWDGDWHFVGADEYDAKGVNRGWFVDDAAKARADDPKYAIYATSWKKTGVHFPMVWAPDDESVQALNVTADYATEPAEAKHELGIRLYHKEKRVVTDGALTTADGQVLAIFKTRADRADLNDMPRMEVVPGTQYRLRFGDRQTDIFTAGEGESIKDIAAEELKPCPKKLTKENVAQLTRLLFDKEIEQSRASRTAEMEVREITLDGKTLKWEEKTFGKAPKGGRSLWISMHGGGGAPTAVNDAQWKNQITLYEPEEGIYIAPRAPTDAWDLWHQEHIDPMFARLIENHVALRGVNPNKVYLMGYSAGGDGVWQLAPRMADRFAAASMMAGHPNEASLLGLYNLPFALFMGGNDSAYKRNTVAAEKAQELARLQEESPRGYVHLIRIYEGLGHWMNGKDKEALPWMAKYERKTWPKKIIWFQDDVVHERCYWLKLPPGAAMVGKKIEATVDLQRIMLEGDVPEGIRIRLSDQLVDLDQPVRVTVNGKEVFNGTVERNPDVLKATLAERLDPASAACAEIVVE